jgi:hypothetical protein
MRSSGKLALSLDLSDVSTATTAELTKQVKPHQLVVVHSREIDDAGEANVGLPTFESTLRQITAAWHHLQLAGVKSFVFTADHGFLLQDETTEQRPFGTKRDPQRRHVVDEYPRAEAGMVNVSMSSLGYEGIDGYLLFRDDTAVFATGTAGATFVHGGNSPQERIIPVLTISRKQAEQAGLAEYAVEVEPQPSVMGLQRLKVRVGFAKQTTTSLGFVSAREVALSLRVPDRTDIRAVVKEVTEPGKVKTGRLVVPVGEAWAEVFFSLEGPADERARVEIGPSDNVEKIQGASPDHWYSVSGMPTPGAGKTASTPPPEMPGTWADAIDDEGIRRVFLHIEKHGVISELEVMGFVTSRGSRRRFTMEFDQLLEKLPFKVLIEPAETGKRYVRGDR